MTHREKLAGVFAPMVTPFEKDAVRLDWLKGNIQKMNETGIGGYLALGSNGEFMSLSEEEQIGVVETFSANRGGKTLLVNVSRESSAETIRFLKRLQGLAFDYISVLPPHYFAKNITDQVMERYFLEVAEASPVPVLVYNAPGFASGVNVKPAVLGKVAAHPNIVGMKDSSPSGIVSFLAETRHLDDFCVMAGSADFFYTALLYGASGGIVSLANYLPQLSCKLYDAFLRGDAEAATALHFQIFGLNRKVSGSYGVAGVKAAMDVTGFGGGEPRSPLIPITAEQKAAIKQVFEEQGIL